MVSEMICVEMLIRLLRRFVIMVGFGSAEKCGELVSVMVGVLEFTIINPRFVLFDSLIKTD